MINLMTSQENHNNTLIVLDEFVITDEERLNDVFSYSERYRALSSVMKVFITPF